MRGMLAFKSMGVKVNLRKACITKDDLSNSTVCPCRISGLRIEASSVVCVKYGKGTHGKCAGLKWLTPKFS